jgi:hypothetical protein
VNLSPTPTEEEEKKKKKEGRVGDDDDPIQKLQFSHIPHIPDIPKLEFPFSFLISSLLYLVYYFIKTKYSK